MTDLDEYPRPNWKYWLRVETLSLTDAVALSLDVDPKAIHLRSNMIYISTTKELQYRYGTSIRLAPDVFRERWNIAYSAVGVSLSAVDLRARQTREELPRIGTNEFVHWALKRDWQIPDELRRLLATTTLIESAPKAPCDLLLSTCPNTVDPEPAKRRGRPTQRAVIRDTLVELIKGGMTFKTKTSAHNEVLKKIGIKDPSGGWSYNTFVKHTSDLFLDK